MKPSCGQGSKPVERQTRGWKQSSLGPTPVARVAQSPVDALPVRGHTGRSLGTRRLLPRNAAGMLLRVGRQRPQSRISTPTPVVTATSSSTIRPRPPPRLGQWRGAPGLLPGDVIAGENPWWLWEYLAPLHAGALRRVRYRGQEQGKDRWAGAAWSRLAVPPPWGSTAHRGAARESVRAGVPFPCAAAALPGASPSIARGGDRSVPSPWARSRSARPVPAV